MDRVKSKKGAVTLPKGFRAAGLAAGIKKDQALDLALLISDAPAKMAAVFTQNRVQAWPVRISRAHLSAKEHYGVFTNSGNANCSNDEKYEGAALRILDAIAEELEIPTHSLMIASTGVIGRAYPAERIEEALSDLITKVSKKGGREAAQAILTTDTVSKEVYTTFTLNGNKVTIAAMAKGAGMIHPNMATMLVYLTTDCAISKPLLQKALSEVARQTFNRMSIDNDMSTNDTVFLMANGLAGNATITTAGAAYQVFQKALLTLCQRLVIDIIRDGEGVTKVCTITVKNAKMEAQAECAARAVANSMLFKTALHGADPNWGRIIAAIGSERAITSDVNVCTITVGRVVVYQRGVALDKKVVSAAKAMQKRDVSIIIDLHAGKACAEFVTSDLTKDYITINADYTT